MSAGIKLAAAGAVALVMASGVKHAGHGITADLTSATSGNLSTRAGWASALLAAVGAPHTSCTMNAVVTWELHEGGGFGNQAENNPLNVNPGPGAGWPGYSATGAWAFPDPQTGLRYTVATLGLPAYGGIRAALRAGNDAQATVNAIENSPWAASHYGHRLTATC
jgi:hypothetical protein